jgi:hypothetical protein
VLFLEREAAEAMISEVREDEPMLVDGCRSRRLSSAQDRQEREVRVAELLISSRRTSEDDLRSLMDRLSVAIPDAESPPPSRAC